LRSIFDAVPVAIRGELRTPVVAGAALSALVGWTSFVLASSVATWDQRARRLQIAELSRSAASLEAELARIRAAMTSLRDLEGEVESARADVARVREAKADAELELRSARQTLLAKERSLSQSAQDLSRQALVSPRDPGADDASLAAGATHKPIADRQKVRRASSRNARGRRR
jgi:hypothetical protein